MEISLFGLFVNIFASYLDVTGSEFVWWDYPVRLIPNLPRLFPIDFSVILAIFMLIYQYYPKWKRFIIANTLNSVVFSFAMEPLMIWLNLYELHTWKLYYSFPIYIAIAVICKYTVNVFLKAQRNVSSD